MSLPDSIEPGYESEPRPQSNIYTAMLGLSFVALCVTIMMLSLEMKAYKYDFKAQNARSVAVPNAGS